MIFDPTLATIPELKSIVCRRYNNSKIRFASDVLWNKFVHLLREFPLFHSHNFIQAKAWVNMKFA